MLRGAIHPDFADVAELHRKLSLALLLNGGFGAPFGDLRMLRVGSAAARCADRV